MIKFGATKKLTPKVVADSFDDDEIKLALEGNWLTIALARFESTFTTRREPDAIEHPEPPTAYGVVHFNYGTDKHIPVEMIMIDQKEPLYPKRSSIGYPRRPFEGIGRANFNYRNKLADEAAYCFMEIVIDDPLGKIAKRLQAAFDSAALNQYQFLHVHFRRDKLDVDPILIELKEEGFGAYHSLSEMTFKHQNVLPNAPAWAWTWSQ